MDNQPEHVQTLAFKEGGSLVWASPSLTYIQWGGDGGREAGWGGVSFVRGSTVPRRWVIVEDLTNIGGGDDDDGDVDDDDVDDGGDVDHGDGGSDVDDDGSDDGDSINVDDGGEDFLSLKKKKKKIH